VYQSGKGTVSFDWSSLIAAELTILPVREALARYSSMACFTDGFIMYDIGCAKYGIGLIRKNGLMEVIV
jgi:hypothetical protein